MENINALYELCDTISKEIEEANEKIRQAGGKLTGSDVGYIDTLTHILKSLKTTIAMEEADGGYSRNDGYSSDGMYPVYRAHDGMSYARGRNAKRDSMGRYSAYNGAYSRHGDMVDDLHRLMQDAPNEQIRKDLQRLVEKVEQM